MRTLLSKLTFDIIPTDENAWRLGAMSEEAVGRELDNFVAEIKQVRDALLDDKTWAL